LRHSFSPRTNACFSLEFLSVLSNRLQFGRVAVSVDPETLLLMDVNNNNLCCLVHPSTAVCRSRCLHPQFGSLGTQNGSNPVQNVTVHTSRNDDSDDMRWLSVVASTSASLILRPRKPWLVTMFEYRLDLQPFIASFPPMLVHR